MNFADLKLKKINIKKFTPLEAQISEITHSSETSKVVKERLIKKVTQKYQLDVHHLTFEEYKYIHSVLKNAYLNMEPIYINPGNYPFSTVLLEDVSELDFKFPITPTKKRNRYSFSLELEA